VEQDRAVLEQGCSASELSAANNLSVLDQQLPTYSMGEAGTGIDRTSLRRSGLSDDESEPTKRVG
jgi:hypothetical protein